MFLIKCEQHVELYNSSKQITIPLLKVQNATLYKKGKRAKNQHLQTLSVGFKNTTLRIERSNIKYWIISSYNYVGTLQNDIALKLFRKSFIDKRNIY